MIIVRWHVARVLLGALAVSASLFGPTANAQLTYSAKSIMGKVADAETGEPLAGVVIVAQWKIDRNFVGDDKALLNVMETVSDSGGDYAFPAWGPISLPPRANFGKGEDPGVYYFKSGYWPQYEQNDLTDDIRRRATPLGEFKGNGQTVKLRKWDGTDIRKYESHLHGLAGSMPGYYGADWRKYPRMTLEIKKVGRLVQKKTKSVLGAAHVEGFYFDRLSKDDLELIRSLTNEE